MSVLVEVCIDNIESLAIAEQSGAKRIELCSSLALGGLTPSAGYMKQAARFSTIPVYAIIRPRQGDFLYSSNDVEIMLSDIHHAKQAGLQGVVIGALQQDGKIDKNTVSALLKEAAGIGVTFHRAIDHCSDPFDALDFLMSSGRCERVLSSGLAAKAELGTEMLCNMVTYAQGHLSIMPGSGVSPTNVRTIVDKTGATEIHLSGLSHRPSLMTYHPSNVTMGMGDDFHIPQTNSDVISRVVKLCQ